MSASLAGIHILNTRPAAQAAGLSATLRAAGATVSELPLIDIRPRELTAAEARLLLDLDRYDAVFFVSANAARHGLEAVAGYWPQWPHALPAYAVGEGTAAPLREAGLTVHLPSRTDSEGLLALPEWQAPAGRRVLVLRGVGGRELLRETLQARGARVDVIELYHRELPPDAAVRWSQLARPDVVLLTSPDALRHWREVAGPEALQPLWLVVSPRLREQAEAAGARVLVAAGVDEGRLLAALQRFL